MSGVAATAAYPATSESAAQSTEALRNFVQFVAAVIDECLPATETLHRITPVLQALLRDDDWLLPAFTVPHEEHYQQYLLHCDAQERFSVVSFVWGPGQQTPIHDHGVWGLIGMLRGSETSTPYRSEAGGLTAGEPIRLHPVDVETLEPRTGDIHRVRNAFADRTSISIHVYGANIGRVRRHVFTEDGAVKPFISGFSSGVVPNIWADAPSIPFETRRENVPSFSAHDRGTACRDADRGTTGDVRQRYRSYRLSAFVDLDGAHTRQWRAG